MLFRSINPAKPAVFRWSVRSIANVYAFVCYINFVENNNASGKAVPAEFRISSRIAESVYGAVSKILKTEARLHQIGGDSGSTPLDLADEAWRRVDGQVTIWRVNALIF